MNLRRGLVVVVLLSAAVFTAGVTLERAAEPESAETVLGINPESPALVSTAIVLTILLATAILLRPTPLVLAATGAFGLAFAFFDGLEIVRQFQEGRLSLVAIASVAGLFHLATTVLAVVFMYHTVAGRRLRGGHAASGT